MTLRQARRLAIAAQGLATRPPGRIDRRHLRGAVDRLGVVQMDAVNVVARAHELTLHARLGAVPSAAAERAAYGRDRACFEYWGHEASLLPLDLHSAFRWRMADARDGRGVYGQVAALGRERPDYVRRILDEVRDRGPLAASDLADGGERTGPWWGWSEGKTALEWLFWTGDLTTAHRRNFERVLDLPERVLPAEVLDAPTPDRAQAHRTLLARAARALGVAMEDDLFDYYRLRPGEARPRLAELVEDGTLVEARVEGWRKPAYLDARATIPRRAAARALLCPFDPLIWHRPRAERLFGFDYRLEIYKPAGQRRFGYYVLPFVLGDRPVARVDLKAARGDGRLLVRSAFGETGIDPGATAAALAESLRAMAGWLGLGAIRVEHTGDLAAPLAREIAG
ncbi:MAG: crosslink repair DNA glycosylase YcaQ family protein [Azospirillaceae bacterium]